MRFCYFLWALSITCGIIFYNFIAAKNSSINFIYILFFVIFPALALSAALLVNKKHLSPKKVKIMFLFFTMLTLFAASIISADFKHKSINEFSIFASENKILGYSQVELSAAGRVKSPPYQKFNNSYFDFEILKLEILNKETNKAVQFEDFGNIFISYKNQGINTLAVNDFIKLNINEAQKYTNDNGSISEIFYISNVEIIEPVGYASYFYTFKSKINECLNFLFFKSLSHENAGVASALILGNQGQIPGDIIESFKKSGIYHLLAISGLHISIITAFIFFILRKILFPLRLKKILFSCFIVLFLIFYNLIVGEKASMLRASIMFILVFFSRDVFKDYSQSNVLLISYSVLLFASPDFLANIGFILSFLSVAALVYISPLVKKIMNYLSKSKNAANNYFIKSMISAFSINILILPVLSYYFGGFSIISIFTNFVAAPIFYILLLDLFISSIAAVFWFYAGSFFIMPANFLINLIVRLSDFFDSLPYGFITTDIFKNKIIIYLFYFSLIIIFSALSFFLKRKAKNNIKIIV